MKQKKIKMADLENSKWLPQNFFRYGQSIFCLPHWPNFSDIFDLCFHWVSVVRVCDYWSRSFILKSFYQITLTWSKIYQQVLGAHHPNIYTVVLSIFSDDGVANWRSSVNHLWHHAILASSCVLGHFCKGTSMPKHLANMTFQL